MKKLYVILDIIDTENQRNAPNNVYAIWATSENEALHKAWFKSGQRRSEAEFFEFFGAYEVKTMENE